MVINHYAVDKDGQYYKWYSPLLKYIALKKEYWPTKENTENRLQQTMDFNSLSRVKHP